MAARVFLACACAALGACSFEGFNRAVDVPPPIEQVTLLGVRYVDLAEGSGVPAVYGSLVRIHYVGSLADGKRFDSSYDRGTPIAFTIGKGEVPKGLEDGVLGQRVGSRRRLTIPPELAYGEQGLDGMIPPNSEVVFEIEIVEIVGP